MNTPTISVEIITPGGARERVGDLRATRNWWELREHAAHLTQKHHFSMVEYRGLRGDLVHRFGTTLRQGTTNG